MWVLFFAMWSTPLYGLEIYFSPQTNHRNYSTVCEKMSWTVTKRVGTLDTVNVIIPQRSHIFFVFIYTTVRQQWTVVVSFLMAQLAGVGPLTCSF